MASCWIAPCVRVAASHARGQDKSRRVGIKGSQQTVVDLCLLCAITGSHRRYHWRPGSLLGWRAQVMQGTYYHNCIIKGPPAQLPVCPPSPRSRARWLQRAKEPQLVHLRNCTVTVAPSSSTMIRLPGALWPQNQRSDSSALPEEDHGGWRSRTAGLSFSRDWHWLRN